MAKFLPRRSREMQSDRAQAGLGGRMTTFSARKRSLDWPGSLDPLGDSKVPRSSVRLSVSAVSLRVGGLLR